jgi:multidrug resistance efflux pump
MGVSSDGHTVSWKLRGISNASAAGLYSTPEVWETGNAVPTGDVYPKRIQIYVL